MSRKRARSEWQKPGMLSHQWCNGMVDRYRRSRVHYSHAAEMRGDKRLYVWIMDFKPFLLWGKPNDGGSHWKP